MAENTQCSNQEIVPAPSYLPYTVPWAGLFHLGPAAGPWVLARLPFSMNMLGWSTTRVRCEAEE